MVGYFKNFSYGISCALGNFCHFRNVKRAVVNQFFFNDNGNCLYFNYFSWASRTPALMVVWRYLFASELGGNGFNCDRYFFGSSNEDVIRRRYFMVKYSAFRWIPGLSRCYLVPNSRMFFRRTARIRYVHLRKIFCPNGDLLFLFRVTRCSYFRVTSTRVIPIIRGKFFGLFRDFFPVTTKRKGLNRQVMTYILPYHIPAQFVRQVMNLVVFSLGFWDGSRIVRDFSVVKIEVLFNRSNGNVPGV